MTAPRQGWRCLGPRGLTHRPPLWPPGPTYQGFGADTLEDGELKVAQDHVRVFSGLYGVLRPLDVIQPYRLDMGTRLAVGGCKNLYALWAERVTAELVSAAQVVRDQYGSGTPRSRPTRPCAREQPLTHAVFRLPAQRRS